MPAVINWKKERDQLEAFMAKMPFRVDPKAIVRNLSAGEKQKIELLKQLYLDRKVIILDEPTSVLTPQESRRVAAAVPGAEYLLIARTGERIMSPGFAALVAAAGPAPAPAPAPAPPPAWDGMELTIAVDLARLDPRARRPYLVAWVEDGDKFPVRTIALWYNKDRYLPELRAWYRSDRLRSMAEGTDLAHSVSSATRSPVVHTPLTNWTMPTRMP